MATPDQEKAAGAVVEAVKSLNAAIHAASRLGIYVDLIHMQEVGCRSYLYAVEKTETREDVRRGGLLHAENEGAPE